MSLGLFCSEYCTDEELDVLKVPSMVVNIFPALSSALLAVLCFATLLKVATCDQLLSASGNVRPDC